MKSYLLRSQKSRDIFTFAIPWLPLKTLEELPIGVYDALTTEPLLKSKPGWIIGFFRRMRRYFDPSAFTSDLDASRVFKLARDLHGPEMLKPGVHVFFTNS
mgnify:CR=1 FL=1